MWKMKLAILIIVSVLIWAAVADRDHLEVNQFAAPVAAPADADSPQPVVQQIQNRDGAHHHAHGAHHLVHHQQFPQVDEYHPEETQEELVYEESQQQHVIYEPETAEQQAQPSYVQPAAYPTYSAPSHTGYYYYYYPVKASKTKFKMPSFSRRVPSLKLPEYVGKEGHESGTSLKNVWAPAVTSLLVASGLYWALPILGLGARRSGRSFSSSPHLSGEHMKTVVQYINRVIERYEQQQQQQL